MVIKIELHDCLLAAKDRKELKMIPSAFLCFLFSAFFSG